MQSACRAAVTQRARTLAAAGVLGLLGAAQLHAAPGDVKLSFDAPCKYPTGLATDGRHLFVLDWMEAQVHEISPADGPGAPGLVRSFAAPALRPQGLTWGDGRLFVSDDRSGSVYALNPDTGIVDWSFVAPGEQPTGLAYVGDSLFLLERKGGQLYKLNPADGTILNYLPAPNATCTALAYDGRYLWSADRVRDELYMIEPATGSVLGIVAAPGPYAAGLACLDGYLWNVDFQTRKVYQLILHEPGGPERKYRLTDPRTARVEMLWTLHNYGPGEVRDLVVGFALPQKLANLEVLSPPEFATPPTRTVPDRWGQPCAVYELPSLAAGARKVLSYTVTAKVSAIRFLVFPEECGTLADIPQDIRQQYTADGARYRIASPALKEIVKKVVGDEQNPARIAWKVYDYVVDALDYEMVGGWDIPEVVLKRGKGSCSEYTFAYIALCRAAGLPARYQGSVVVRGDDACIDDVFHRWAQVYLPNYGWVPVDSSRGGKKIPVDRSRGFGELSNRYLITTEGGGASEYLDWDYNAFARYKTTGYAKVEEEKFALWEPLQATTTTTAPAAEPPQCKPK